MASGFLILPDGRCFSRRWACHDQILRVLANELTAEGAELALRDWLISQLPGSDDIEELGYGAWFRTSNQEHIVRNIDLRRMATKYQILFCEAVKRATAKTPVDEYTSVPILDLADLVARYEKGEPPRSKSDSREVIPQEPGLIGPT
jgi:hypothetical protein